MARKKENNANAALMWKVNEFTIVCVEEEQNLD